jgi:hypothetical protein
MFGIMAALSVARNVAEAELDEVPGRVRQRGRYAASAALADARAVRFEVMTPTAAVRRTERAAALINPMCEEAARIAGGLRG